ncbi:glycosyltransferase [Deltaproteobacteria bacterium IMCC39524]|nr:glycosyltransferase [Deltaproteobacteria bacterium IMCC39524]
MKILFITDGFKAGGRQRQLLEFLKGLKAYPEISYKLVMLSDCNEYPELDDLAIDICVLKRHIKKDPTIFFRLFKICRAYRPDIVHSCESMCTFYAIPVVKLLGIKLINNIIRNAGSRAGPWFRRWTFPRITFPFSDIIISNSQAGINFFNPPRHKTYCVYNGFDFKRMKNLKDPAIIRQELGIESQYVIGMVASFTALKDQSALIKAAHHILRQRNNVTFLFVGDGEKRTACESEVDPVFVDRILFAGRRDDVESIVSVLTVGVLSTPREGISNSIMEYMAGGKPVVVTRGGGTEELVVDGETGYVLDPGDIGGMAKSITSLLENQTVAHRMGEAGRLRLEKNFGLDVMVQRQLEVHRICMQDHDFDKSAPN